MERLPSLDVGCWMLDVQLTSLEHNIREGNSVISDPGDTVVCRSRLNASRSFEVFTPTDFLAAITRHIPNKGAQMVRYYGCANRLSAAGSRPPAKPTHFARRQALGRHPARTASPISGKVPGWAGRFRPCRRQNGHKAGTICRLTGACRSGIILSW